MVTCIVALLLAGTSFVIWQWKSLCHSMVLNLSTQAGIIADNCKAALAFEDVKDAEDILMALKAEPSIVFACIYTGSGKVFARYHHKKTGNAISTPRPRSVGHFIDERHITVYKPVILDSEPIGTVCLKSNLEPIYSMLKNSIDITVGVLLFASLIAYLLSNTLRNIIADPILNLARTTSVVSGKKDYSIRAKKHSNDETGKLIDSFNEMLEQIQNRDSALVNANEKLTKEVIERMKVEETLEATNEQLEKTVEKLTASNRELKDFAYVVAHDLKTPLRGISTLANWLRSDYRNNFDDEGQEQIDLLMGRVNRMHNLIEGILQYSRIGLVKEDRARTDLNQLVKDIIEIVSAPENIKVSIKNKLPVIECDQTHITQVFQNLISNAIKYIDKPEGWIKIGCIEQDGFWRFSIADNGRGIEEKYFEKIFKIFETLSPSDEFESTGIGLTIIKKVVEMYGGNTWVESEAGKGSTFFFTLPKIRHGGKKTKYQSKTVLGAKT
jgi:signal transduction histidine kinase